MTHHPEPHAPVPLPPDDRQRLRTTRLFAGLDAADLEAFADHLDATSFGPGAVVVREGDEAGFIYFVLEGEALIRRRGLHIRRAGPGELFGEMAFMGFRPRAATIEAAGPLRLARLSRDAYRNLGRRRPTLALWFLQALIASLGDQLVEVTESFDRLLRERALPRRLELEVGLAGETRKVRTGTLVMALLPGSLDGALVVAGLVDNRPVGLETPITSDARLSPITLGTWEGRHIYRRSVALVLLEAARRLDPALKLRIGVSLGFGQVVRIESGWTGDPADLAQRLTTDIARLTAEDADLCDELWGVEEARTHFEQIGDHDAVALLRSWREVAVPVTRCEETAAIRLGPVLASAGAVRDVHLTAHPSGILLDFGEPIARRLAGGPVNRESARAQETRAPRFGGEMIADHRGWLSSMGIGSVGMFNEACVSGQVPQLIRVAEGFHERWIGRIADRVHRKRGRIRLIRIAGPSSSGKTTFIKRLTVQLAIHGLSSVTLGLDDYDVDRERNVRDPGGEYDFEALEAIDRDLLHDQLRRLIAGEALTLARYDFLAGRSLPDGGRRTTLGPDGLVILEGIHGLHPDLLDSAVDPSSTFSIFLHPSLDLSLDRSAVVAPADVRLVRRIVRDRHQRGTGAADNIARWLSVRRGEHRHIYAHKERADLVFDSSLVYEMSVLKVFAERYLLEIPQDHPSFPTAFRLRQLLDRWVSIYPDHVPHTSILREFIGGSGFEY